MFQKPKKKLQIVVIVIILLLALNYYLGQAYTIIAPGITVELKDVITVENGSKNSKEGSFLLTTVSSRSLNLPLLIYACINPHVNIERKGQIIPLGWDMDQYMDYMKKWMEESQKIAEVVALKKAGYNPQILGDGAQIVEIMPGSPAIGKLFPGDIIKKVDQKEVCKKVSDHNIDELVELEIEREDNMKTLLIPTM